MKMKGVIDIVRSSVNYEIQTYIYYFNQLYSIS